MQDYTEPRHSAPPFPPWLRQTANRVKGSLRWLTPPLTRRVTAGSLVLAFFGLGLLTSKKFFLGAGLVGAGLVYAGVSGNCMMASAHGRMPWNDPEKANA